MDQEFPAYTGLSLDRYYNSLDDTKTTFGVGWRSNWQRGLQVATDGLSARFIREDSQTVTFTKSGTTWISDADVTAKLVSTTGGFNLSRENGDVEHFDLNGKLQTVTTPSGLVTTVGYSADLGLLQTVTGPYGHTLTFAYSGEFVSQITLPDAKTIGFGYDASGNLIDVTHADTTHRGYKYEDTRFPNALTGIVDEKNQRFATYGYDADGKANLSTHAGSAEKTTLAYNTDGTTTVTDARGLVHTNSFTTLNNVTKLAAETGTPNLRAGAKEYTYYPNGFVKTRKDWRNVITFFQHDNRGNETLRTEAQGTALARTITTTWHPTLNLPLVITEPTRTTTYNRKANGEINTKTVKDNATGETRVWTYTYGTAGGDKGQIIQIDGPRTDVIDITKFEHDAGGGLSKITDALNHATFIHNDVNGRPDTITDPNGLITKIVYNPRGMVVSVTEELEKTQYIRDLNGDVRQVILPSGARLTYGIDAAHRLRSVTDSLGNKITVLCES